MSNFLGKKISLISKALIRYEGVLYTIDQSAFTVALSKVKSFGTEDRPAERFIAARDEVYEYIIFRGSDISDLHVCDSVYADDSAIVKIMSPNTTNPSSPPVKSSRNIDVNVESNASNSITQRQEPLSPSVNINKRFMDLSKAINRNDENNFVNSQDQRHIKYNAAYNSNCEADDLEEIAAHDYRQFKNREHVTKSDLTYNPGANEDIRQYSSYRKGTARRGVRGSFDGNNARGYMSTAARGRQTFMNNKDVLSIDSIKDDFDFESSNALMAEELANMQLSHNDSASTGKINRGLYSREDTTDNDGDGNEEDEKVFYDKSKSFFDNISCEVCDHSGNSMGDRRRRNNVETFGCSDYSRGNYRGSRWNGARGAFRGNYGGSSAGFIRRGGNSRRGDGRMDYRGQFTQRRTYLVNGGASTYDDDN